MTALKAQSKLIFGGAIIVLAVGYLIVSSIGGSTAKLTLMSGLGSHARFSAAWEPPLLVACDLLKLGR